MSVNIYSKGKLTKIAGNAAEGGVKKSFIINYEDFQIDSNHPLRVFDYPITNIEQVKPIFTQAAQAYEEGRDILLKFNDIDTTSLATIVDIAYTDLHDLKFITLTFTATYTPTAQYVFVCNFETNTAFQSFNFGEIYALNEEGPIPSNQLPTSNGTGGINWRSVADLEYTLPQATSAKLGGIKAAEKTTAETEEVKIETSTGKLFVKPSEAKEPFIINYTDFQLGEDNPNDPTQPIPILNYDQAEIIFKNAYKAYQEHRDILFKQSTGTFSLKAILTYFQQENLSEIIFEFSAMMIPTLSYALSCNFTGKNANISLVFGRLFPIDSRGELAPPGHFPVSNSQGEIDWYPVTDLEYTLPQATNTELGGIKAAEKTELDTEEVKIETSTGKLFVKPGLQGPAGKDGQQGPAGINGENGAPGKSAYQYAQESGYSLTEQQFSQDLAKIHTDYTIWAGTQSEYDSISPHDSNTLYFIKEG